MAAPDWVSRPAARPGPQADDARAPVKERQATPAGRAKLRERVKVEHAHAHVGHWQGHRARYRGTRKKCTFSA
jgi:hypothetical protein